jgi:predicted nucleotidyltransferase
MVLDINFKEFIGLLNEHKVKFLVIGGYAVNFHGYPRYTKDMDFWIWLDTVNIHNLMKALNDFGFGSVGLTEADFRHPKNIIQLGYEPLRIDILMELEKCDFEECYQRKTQISFDDVNVDFLNIDDLITVKKQAGRLQDLADAENLEKLKKK